VRIARWLELGCGLASGIVGLAIIAFTLFGPSYQGEMCTSTADAGGTTCTPTTATLAQINNGIPPLALLYFSALAVLLLALMISMLLHWRSGSNAWRWCLWIVAGLFTLVSLAGLDLFVLMAPSVVLAFVSLLAAQSTRPVTAG
jgi:hypothetical protein